MSDENGTQNTEIDEAWQRVHAAVADYFGVEPEGVFGLVLACERIDPERQTLVLSSAWSAATPVWRLESFARELLLTISRSLRQEVADHE
jgi:hypothetical protein